MSISERTRKVLWTRAHDRCAFPGCRQVLTVDMVDTTTGDSFVKPVGEEAHIRSRRPDGPRHDPSYPTAELDEYENLILLCPTHHTMVDANGGAGYSVEQLDRLRRQHEKQQGRRAQLDQTVQAYLADQYGADDTVLFQQVDLRGPSVDAMFVDVPFGCRPGAAVAALMSRITAEHPGDREATEDADGYIVTGAAQALLHPDWSSSALLVGGPGQGKSTLLQYVCQFHRARRLGRQTYTGSAQALTPVTGIARVAVRIDLRKYAQWASGNTRRDRSPASKHHKAKPAGSIWPSIEEYIAADIAQRSGGNTFRVKDLAVLVAADAVLIALDGLDEVANLKHREQVSNEIVATHRRLTANASDLVMLVATRPGPTSSALTSAPEFPTLHLRRLSQGLRLQYLRQWAAVSGLSSEAEAKLQTTFMDNQQVPHIRELASYPMQLAILLHLLHRRQLFPQQRTELYREYLKTFLDREQTEDKEPLLAQDRKVIEDIHAYLGWLLQARAEEGTSSGAIDREELRRVLHERLEGREDGQKLAERLFSAVTTRVLCLIERDPGAFQFEVQSLREYFAALFIFDNAPPRGKGNSRDDCLNALLERPYWSNVCRFLVGMFSGVEVRGIRQNLQQADRRAQGHPMVRSLGALFLDDRTYEGQASGPIQEVVDFVLAGPGVVLAEDGLLDGAGGALVLAERAGRAQAVRHLEDRLPGEGSPAVREVITSSLRRHATPDDDLPGWWWGRFEPTMEWLEVCAGLDALRSLDGTRNGQLVELLASVRSDTTWRSELLAQGGYDRLTDAVVKLVIDELNDGAIDALAVLASDAPVGMLIEAAAVAALRPTLAPRRATGQPADGRRRRVRRRNGLFDDVLAATDRLRIRPAPSATGDDWQQRLELVARVWGDGWVLRQAISAVPTAVDLADIGTVLATKRAGLSQVIALEAQARACRADANWWRQRFGECSTDFERRHWLVTLLTRAHAPVITALSVEINGVVDGLAPKHYAGLWHCLNASGRWQLGELHIQDPLRLRQVVFTARALWLLRPVVTQASAEQIDKHLVDGFTDVLGLGVGDLRALMRAVGQRKSVPLESLRGTRRVLPSGGWVSEVRLGAMPRKLAAEILAAPGDWPSDVVQQAPQSAAMRPLSIAKPLSRVAEEDHWFQVAEHS